MQHSISMVDLKAQYALIKDEIDKGISEVIDNTAFINGPAVKSFQKNLSDYLGGAHVIPCANGTDALQIAMMALDLQPGDEIITADFTYVATAEVIALLQLKPILVDVDPRTFNIDLAQMEAAIGPRTKAIVPVHLFGQCADMAPILAIAAKHNLYVIEDTAQAIGATYTFPDGRQAKAGTMGTIGCTSFFPSKNLGCYGDGGAIFTNDAQLAEKIRVIANHGQKVQYYHDEIGVNSRLDSLQAAVLNAKLPHLDRYNTTRRWAADYYNEAFADVSWLVTPLISKNSTHVFHQYTLQLDEKLDRQALRDHLTALGIPSMIYYPVPLHQQKAYEQAGTFPVTEKLCRSVFSLPMHSELTVEVLDYIIEGVKSFSKLG
ncbi:MAG: DegT/DnrJ/EryC1/StrS family aminotransferase [Sphingobacteriaceae bacterium]|nr:DegT/DnrJ/EryC1/StrS family aminotransferase [Sphingobacteriaceae bacterium]